jgi:hypothetical protein
MPYGNYTIWASCLLPAGENSLANNKCTGGTIIITIPGDINGDFKANLQDLVLLSNAYNSHFNDSKWNPNADINGNGAVDLADLFLLANHYNQHYP